MSTTSHHLKTPEAPWKSTFLSHVAKLDSPEFVFTTLHPASPSSPTPYVPRLRYCIFRGMWGELPENKHNDAPRNERIYESDMPAFTTDVRSEKVWDLFTTGDGHATKDEQIQGSGGGGPVEAVWWIKETNTQWRIRGTAYVVGNDIEEEGAQSSGVRTVKSEIGARMRVVKEGDWSWATELTAHFGNLSPQSRGAWKAPKPSLPVESNPPDKAHEPGQKVTDLYDSVSRENFRVVIIKPDEVEQKDLSDPATSRKYTYTLVIEDGQATWRVEEQWP